MEKIHSGKENISSENLNNSSSIIPPNSVIWNDSKCGDIRITETEIREILGNLNTIFSKINKEKPYILEYKKNTFTLDEAKNLLATGATNSLKKDYTSLIAGKNIPQIPKIFEIIPNDDIAFYIKNPKDLEYITNYSTNIFSEYIGIDNKKSIDNFIQTIFWKENFNIFIKSIQSDFAIVGENLDITNPEIAIIVHNSDKNVLSSTNPNFITADLWDFSILSNSKILLEKIKNTKENNSLASSADFKYLWMRKADKIQSAFFFVGDAFFEKMLTFENFIKHHRKFLEYSELSSIQELQWAYNRAFWKYFTKLEELKSLGIEDLGDSFWKKISIENDGTIINSIIGTLKDTKVLSENNFPIIYSRAEIDLYKEAIGDYKEVWRSSLDPMGITLNKYNDGVSIDFIMTPLPSFTNEFAELSKNLKNISRDHLSFFTNPKIRNGIASLVFGFDTEKAKNISDPNILEVLGMVNNEVLGGKNILDYLDGEFAVSLGGISPDILEWWNIEKIDGFFAFSVKSEAKWKEILDILRTNALSRMWGNEAENIFKKVFAKPFIEDYKDKKIYFIENISSPFLGNIWFAYTFVDNFLFIAPNKTSIKKVIDTAISGDENKTKTLWDTNFASWTFFASSFDGEGITKQFREMHTSNKVALFQGWDLIPYRAVDTLVAYEYADQEKNMYLGKMEPFHFELWGVELAAKNQDIYVQFHKINTSGMDEDYKKMYQEWEQKQNPKIFSDWISYREFLQNGNMDELNTTLTFWINDIIKKENIVPNITFGASILTDEIGFELKSYFKNSEQAKILTSIKNKEFLYSMIALIVSLLLLCGCAYYVYKRGKDDTAISTISNDKENTIINEKSDIIVNKNKMKDEI